MKSEKKMTTIRVNPQILKKAQELGLNISKTVENLLKNYIEDIEQLQKQNQTQNKWARPDLNRRPSPRERSLTVDWDGFARFLCEVYDNERTRRQRFNYARRYADVLLKRDFGCLFQLSLDKRAHILKSLSALSKFLGVYQDFKEEIKRYGLSWSGRSGDDRIISRLTKVKDPDEVFNWIRLVKDSNSDLDVFMDLIAVTGMRLIETVRSYNLIISLSKEGNLSEYFNFENESLEHYKFKDLFIRRSKKVFFSFVPRELVEKIAHYNKALSVGMIESRMKRSPYPSRFSDVREAHATFMIKYLRPSEIDFLHGRVGTDVFMRNYFNPKLIEDLKQRTFQGIEEILAKIG